MAEKIINVTIPVKIIEELDKPTRIEIVFNEANIKLGLEKTDLIIILNGIVLGYWK